MPLCRGASNAFALLFIASTTVNTANAANAANPDNVSIGVVAQVLPYDLYVPALPYAKSITPLR